MFLFGGILRRKFFYMENLKEMFVRWVVDNLDLKNVVKDVLLFGRFLLVVF